MYTFALSETLVILMDFSFADCCVQRNKLLDLLFLSELGSSRFRVWLESFSCIMFYECVAMTPMSMSIHSSWIPLHISNWDS